MILDAFQRLFATVVDALYPRRCPLCDCFLDGRATLCDDCAVSLISLESDAHLPSLTRAWFSRCRSIFAYDGRVKDALHGFKYSRRLDLERFFGDLVAGEAEAMGGFDIIVPVPLHSARLRSRGFNQAALVARRAAKKLRVIVELDVLRRVKDVEPQVGLKRNERIENVKGAFAVEGRSSARIKDRKILIIDDVLTTGATANECARALMKSGAASVDVLTIARTL